MSIVPRAPYGSLLKGNPLGAKQDAAPKDEKSKDRKKPKKDKRK